jgi:ribosome maturation protein SDO1
MISRSHKALTNTVLAKKRFEIACYKNKVLEWRNGNEKDLDNILQIPNVFLNVSKGQVASHQDLAKAFGPDTKLDDIILEILNKGELQVGDKERHEQLEMVRNEIVDIVTARLVDPKTKRVYTSGMIEKALDQLSSQSQQKEAIVPSGTDTPAEGDSEEVKPKNLPTWTGVVATKSAKSQALEAMKALIAHQPIPVARARMRLRITCPTGLLKQSVKSSASKPGASSGKKGASAGDGAEETKETGTIKDKILSYVEQVESQDTAGSDWEVVGFVEPGAYKELSEFIGAHTKGKARVEVLDMAVIHDGD